MIKEYFSELKELIEKTEIKEIENIVQILKEVYKKDKSIFIIGNGGSASTASHFACDLGKGTINNYNNLNEKRFKVYSLVDNISLITAYGNDLSYEEIFSQQLKNFAKKGDVLISLTGSGNSRNIVKANEIAKEIGVVTIGFLGFNGGKVGEIVDERIIIPSKNYGIIEDIHLILSHIISQELKENLKRE
jgi:D-sedoheptulose 7-phosphate isomerase